MNYRLYIVYLHALLVYFSDAKKKKFIKQVNRELDKKLDKKRNKKLNKKQKIKVGKMSILEHKIPMDVGLVALGMQAASSIYTHFLETEKEKDLLSSQVIRETIKAKKESILSKLPASFLHMCPLLRDEYERKDESSFCGLEGPIIVSVILILFKFNKALLSSAKQLLSMFVMKPFTLLKRSIYFVLSFWLFVCWYLPMGCCARLKNWVQLIWRNTKRLKNRIQLIWRNIWHRIVGCFSRKKNNNVKRSSRSYDSTGRLNRRVEEIMGDLNRASIPSPVREERRQSTVDNFHRNDDDLKAFEDSLKPTKEEIDRDNLFREKMGQLNEKSREIKRRIDEASQPVKDDFSDDGSDARRREDDEKFREELAERRRQQEEEIRRMRKEREQMMRDFEEELARIRRGAQEKTIAFFKCVELKIRFEQKEQEWSDLLNSIRKPLVTVAISHRDLIDELRNLQRKNSDNDISWLESVATIFAQNVANAQYVLDGVFRELERIPGENRNRVFVRMMMKSISEAGQQCQRIGEKLVEVMQNPTCVETCSELKDAISQLSPHSIPSTYYLRRNEPIEVNYPEKYIDIPSVPHPDWFPYFQQ